MRRRFLVALILFGGLLLLSTSVRESSAILTRGGSPFVEFLNGLSLKRILENAASRRGLEGQAAESAAPPLLFTLFLFERRGEDGVSEHLLSALFEAAESFASLRQALEEEAGTAGVLGMRPVRFGVFECKSGDAALCEDSLPLSGKPALLLLRDFSRQSDGAEAEASAALASSGETGPSARSSAQTASAVVEAVFETLSLPDAALLQLFVLRHAASFVPPSEEYSSLKGAPVLEVGSSELVRRLHFDARTGPPLPSLVFCASDGAASLKASEAVAVAVAEGERAALAAFVEESRVSENIFLFARDAAICRELAPLVAEEGEEETFSFVKDDAPSFQLLALSPLTAQSAASEDLQQRSLHEGFVLTLDALWMRSAERAKLREAAFRLRQENNADAACVSLLEAQLNSAFSLPAMRGGCGLKASPALNAEAVRRFASLYRLPPVAFFGEQNFLLLRKARRPEDARLAVTLASDLRILGHSFEEAAEHADDAEGSERSLARDTPAEAIFGVANEARELEAEQRRRAAGVRRVLRKKAEETLAQFLAAATQEVFFPVLDRGLSEQHQQPSESESLGRRFLRWLLREQPVFSFAVVEGAIFQEALETWGVYAPVELPAVVVFSPLVVAKVPDGEEGASLLGASLLTKAFYFRDRRRLVLQRLSEGLRLIRENSLEAYEEDAEDWFGRGTWIRDFAGFVLRSTRRSFVEWLYLPPLQKAGQLIWSLCCILLAIVVFLLVVCNACDCTDALLFSRRLLKAAVDFCESLLRRELLAWRCCLVKATRSLPGAAWFLPFRRREEPDGSRLTEGPRREKAE